MELQRFKQKFHVNNFDIEQNKQGRQRHGMLFPNTIRAIICGKSNCGKTNLLMSLITHPNGLKFENIYLYSKSLNQPKYILLREIMNGLKSYVSFFSYDNNTDIVSPSLVKKNSLIIFDDVICDKQNNIKEYFARGRHYLCDTIFLAQTYSAISKQLIRDNANFVIIYKMDDLNLKHVYSDFVSTDMSFEKFRELCRVCWNSNQFSFLCIDLESDLQGGRFRFGLDKYFRNI